MSRRWLAEAALAAALPFYNTFTWNERGGTWTSRMENAGKDGKRSLCAEDMYRRP